MYFSNCSMYCNSSTIYQMLNSQTSPKRLHEYMHTMHATNNSVWPWVCDEVQELNLPNALVLFIVYYMSQLTGLREAWPWRMICNNCTICSSSPWRWLMWFVLSFWSQQMMMQATARAGQVPGSMYPVPPMIPPPYWVHMMAQQAAAGRLPMPANGWVCIILYSTSWEQVVSIVWVHISSTISLPSLKSTFSQPFKEKCKSEVVRIGSIIKFRMSKLREAKFFTLCDAIFLVRLQGKFGVDHTWEWKG